MAIYDDLVSIKNFLRAENYNSAIELANTIIQGIDSGKIVVNVELYRDLPGLISEISALSYAQASNATTEKLVSRLQNSYDVFVSKQYGFPVTSFEYKMGIASQDLPRLMSDTEKKIEPGQALIPSYGDNNCGPRAIIQSLLMRGVTLNQKERVVAFLREIYDKQHDRVARSEYCAAKKKISNEEFEQFIEQYMRADFDLSNFMTQYFPHYVLDYQGNQSISVPLDDKYCYFLAGCLRFDMADYSKIVMEPELKMSMYDLACLENENLRRLGREEIDPYRLGQELDLSMVKEYFPAHNLKLQTTVLQYNNVSAAGVQYNPSWDVKQDYSTPDGQDFLPIDINQGTNHFDARVVPSIDGIAARAARASLAPPPQQAPAPIPVQEKIPEKVPATVQSNINFSFYLKAMAHKHPIKTGIAAGIIVLASLAAVVALGVVTGPVGWAALAVTVAAFLHTTPMVLGIVGAAVTVGGVGLSAVGFFSYKRELADIKKKTNADTSSVPDATAGSNPAEPSKS